MVECLTDNVNRTAPEMRVLFRKGQLGTSGSVSRTGFCVRPMNTVWLPLLAGLSGAAVVVVGCIATGSRALSEARWQHGLQPQLLLLHVHDTFTAHPS